jgi:hypothetical protein
MSMIRRTLAVAALLTPLVYSLAIADPASQADSGCGSGASSNGVDITTFVCLYLNNTPVEPSQTTPAPGETAPPVCWLEPQYTPAELQSYIVTESSLPLSVVAEGVEMYGKWLAHYGTAVKPPYKLGQDGWWWGVGCDPTNLNASTYAEQIWSEVGLGVFKPWEWEATTTQPKVPATVPVVTPTILAEYARDAFGPQQPTTTTSPATTQTVGLTTYFAGTTHALVDVSAALPNDGLVENVVGTPETATIHITTVSAGGTTTDTTVSCPVSTDGKYGATSNGAPAESKCSYTPTEPGTTSYTVTITWLWNWLEADGAAGWPLTTVSPVEQVGPLNVQEVQTVNN